MIILITTLEERQRMGKLIKEQRKANGFTQSDIAKILSIGKFTISDYEHGNIKVIPFEKRVALSMILDINAEDLLYEKEKGQVNTDFIPKAQNDFANLVEELIEKQEEEERTGYTAGIVSDILLLSKHSDNINIEVAFHSVFSKRGLAETDALAMAKFFTWLCMEQPNVLSRWNDKMLRDKMDADKK